MKYKSFDLSLSGVYSTVNSVKKYSLIVKCDDKVIYESPYEYDSDKDAFSMI